MTPIVVAIEVDGITGELPKKSPGLSFYVKPESWENVPKAVERLTSEFEKGSGSWYDERRTYAEEVRARGNTLIFVPSLVPA